MRKRIIVVLTLSTFILSSVCTPALAARKLLSVRAYEQEKTQWCWAASCRSVIKYCDGSSVSQEDIFEYIFGKVVNKPTGVTNMKKALAHWNVSSSKKLDPLTYSGLKSQINDEQPIIAVLLKSGTDKGHANVIRGYDTSYDGVLFIDPADGDYHGQAYDDYLNGEHWNGVEYEWVNTVFDCH